MTISTSKSNIMDITMKNGIPIEEISFTSLAKIAKELDIKIVADQ